jgi:hypothetical protein
MRRLVISVLAAGIVTVATGCGTNNPSQVSKAAAQALAQPVAELRDAASGHSIPTMTSKEQALIAEVNQLVQAGDLSAVRGQKIADAAAALLNDFVHKNTPTAPPTTQTPTETPTETPTVTPTVTVTQSPTETPTETPTVTPTETKTKKAKFPKVPPH